MPRFCEILPEVSPSTALPRESMATTAEGQLAIEGTTGNFRSLEEKIYRTIELLKEARAQKAAAELELTTLRESFDAQAAECESLRRQLATLQQERSQVRQRVEVLLGEVDSILEQ
jgi:gamma-glutamyl:cysteine ligase YbdK (ATP-grasp superfamily)